MENDKGQDKNIKVFYNTINYDNIFSNRNNLYLFRKIERISAALYLISDMFPDNEPLKWSIRRGAGDLIRDILSLVNKSVMEETNTLKDMKRKVLELSSYLSVSNLIGLVTNMNSSIILREIENLIKVLDFEIKRHPSVDGEISNDFFEEKVKDTKKTSKGQKDMKREDYVFYNNRKEKTNKNDINLNTDNKNIILYANDNLNESELISRFAKKSFSKRKSDILDILRIDGKVSIKDISSKVIGCSEKTIQRDLTQLVLDGLVYKEGERRWSKYFLKN